MSSHISSMNQASSENQASSVNRDSTSQTRHIILIPDSFKGTLDSTEICHLMAEAILHHKPQTKVTKIPVADGGEGSVDAFLSAMGGNKHQAKVKGPIGDVIDAFYGILPDGTAVVEMAAAAGLPLVGPTKDVANTTTFGVGQLISKALDQGIKKLIVGLGGSCTNDGGCGAAAALGASFKNKNGETFIPVGGTLKDIAKIDLSGLDPRLKDIEISTMCDIDNPLTGELGAAAIFAPQKGASPELVRILDFGLKHLAEVVRNDLHFDIEMLPGAGAAGGMGGGMVAFLSSKLEMGIDVVLDTVNFDHLVQSADLVMTGEGKIDTQSLRGKVVIGVARRSKAHNVPVFAIVGDIGDNIEPAYDMGVSGIISINRVAVPFHEAKQRAKKDLSLTVDNFVRMLIRLGQL